MRGILLLMDIIICILDFFYTIRKGTQTKDVHRKISDSACEGQFVSAFLNNNIDIEDRIMFTTVKHIRNVILSKFPFTYCYCGYLSGVNLQQCANC